METTIRTTTRIITACACAAALVACSDDASDEDATATDALTVKLAFAPRFGASDFACGTSYDGIGSTASTMTPTDLRFYVHDVRLLSANGDEVPVTLTQDGQWQYQDLALLDFENGCDAGDTAMNTTIRGTVPPGDYTGIAFIVGVPFDLNHIDALSAPPPLDVPAMFWTWNSGYKHLRIDASTNGLGADGYHIHMGSTGCQGDGQGHVTGCLADNRPQITLTGFDPLSGRIVFDLAQLLAETNINQNTDRTAPGCFADDDDPDCTAILTRLGLKGSTQIAFRGE